MLFNSEQIHKAQGVSSKRLLATFYHPSLHGAPGLMGFTSRPLLGCTCLALGLLYPEDQLDYCETLILLKRQSNDGLCLRLLPSVTPQLGSALDSSGQGACRSHAGDAKEDPSLSGTPGGIGSMEKYILTGQRSREKCGPPASL